MHGSGSRAQREWDQYAGGLRRTPTVRFPGGSTQSGTRPRVRPGSASPKSVTITGESFPTPRSARPQLVSELGDRRSLKVHQGREARKWGEKAGGPALRSLRKPGGRKGEAPQPSPPALVLWPGERGGGRRRRLPGPHAVSASPQCLLARSPGPRVWATGWLVRGSFAHRASPGAQGGLRCLQPRILRRAQVEGSAHSQVTG